MPRFVENPAFRPHLIRATDKALGDVARDLQRVGKRNARWSTGVRRKVYARVRPEAGGSRIIFSTGSSLQNIAENPKGNRRTSKGANRGRMPRKPVMEPTIQEVLPKGLPLRRHL